MAATAAVAAAAAIALVDLLKLLVRSLFHSSDRFAPMQRSMNSDFEDENEICYTLKRRVHPIHFSLSAMTIRIRHLLGLIPMKSTMIHSIESNHLLFSPRWKIVDQRNAMSIIFRNAMKTSHMICRSPQVSSMLSLIPMNSILIFKL